MAAHPQVPVVKFFSPEKEDQGLIEIWSAEAADYQPLDLGIAHPDTSNYSGFKLGKQMNMPNDPKWVFRIWVKDDNNAPWFNYAVKYLAESAAHPIFVRNFRELRSTYAPRTKGQPLKAVYKLTLTGAGSGYIPGSAPALAFSGGAGSGAAGHAVVNPDGTIAELVLDSGGTGYTSAPTFTIAAPSTGTTATGTATIQPATALLTTEQADEFPDDSEFNGLYLNVTRVYETLPGPYIPFTRYDDDLGPIQGTRRAVLNTGQVTTLGATSKVTYEGRDGSSIVLWEISESWSNGTGSAGNPVYPFGITEFYDNDRGAVHQTSQITTDTTSVGSLTVIGSTATQIRFEPFQDNPNLRRKIVETWTVPGPVQTSTDFEKDGVKKVVTRQQMKAADVVTTETLATGTLTRKYGERLNAVLAFQIVETITVIDGDLLDLPSFTTSILNLIPEQFRAQIPTHVESHIVEGTAAEPALATGEFEHSERQLTPLYKEVRSTILDNIGALPIAISGIKETNDKKQVVSVSMTLEVDTTTPAAPTATTEVDFRKLGNGLAVEIIKTVPSVFDAAVYEDSRADTIPERFKAGTPAVTTKHIATGTASAPTLATGDLLRREQQIDEFTYELTITNRNIASLPTLHGQKYDEQLNVIIPYTEQVVSAGSAIGNAHTEVSPLGSGLDLVTTYDLTAVQSALDAYMLVFPGSANLQIPDELTEIIPFVETNRGDGDSSETTPSAAWSGSGSFTAVARATAQASLAKIPDATYNIKQHWGHNVPTSHYMFFLPKDGVTVAAINAKVGAVGGWPKFAPQTAQVICVGQRASLQVSASASWHNGGSSTSSEDSQTHGNGQSVEAGLLIKVIRIPATLHDTIGAGGDPADTGTADESDVEDLTVTVTADAYTVSDARTATVPSVQGNIFIKCFATDPVTVPVTGVYVYHTDSEPFKYDRVKVHVETVDFADVP